MAPPSKNAMVSPPAFPPASDALPNPSRLSEDFRSGSLGHAAAVFILTAAYFVSAKLGLQLASVSPYATVVWPPTGIALASLIILGHRVWPGVFLGAFLANLTVDGALAPSLLIAAGNTLEGLAGAALTNRFANGRDCFHRPQDTFKYAILAGVGATSISATIGTVTLWLGGTSGNDAFGVVWLTWWLGDGTSVLTIAPVILLWSGRDRALRQAARLPELAALGLFTLSVGILAFKGGHPLSERIHPLSYLWVSPLLWAALRFGPLEAAATVFLLSAMAVWGGIGGAAPHNPESLLSLQVFVGLISLMVMPLAASIHERKVTLHLLRRREQELTDFLENAVLGMHWMNADGEIIWANDAELALLGYSRDEYVGRRIAEFHVDPETVNDIFRKLENGGEVQDYEAKLKRKDGSIAHVLIDSNALRDNGRIIHTRCFLRDISERKRAADELRKANESLEMRVEERTISLARANRDLAAEIQERKHAEALVRGQNEILLQMASGAPLPSVLESVAAFAEARSGGGSCAVLMHGDGGTRLRVIAAPRLTWAHRQAIEEMGIPSDLDRPAPAQPGKVLAEPGGAFPEPLWGRYRSGLYT